MKRNILTILAAAAVAVALISAGAAQSGKGKAKANKKSGPPAVGYDDTPYLPDQKWRVHDIARPHPPLVTPGAQPGQAPSDAIVLFDGKDLSQWISTPPKGAKGGPATMPPAWKVENGYVEVVPGTGDLFTKEKFGDIQLHIEWASPAKSRAPASGAATAA